MRALLLVLLIVSSLSADAVERLGCGFDCVDELRLSGVQLSGSPQAGLSLPLELYRSSSSPWVTTPALQTTPAALSLRLEPSRWMLHRARPEFKWQGEWGSGMMRLGGHRLRLRFQNPDQTQQLQFTLKPEAVRLEFRWRY